MRVVYFGSPSFAADILSDIAPRVDIVCVYTQPDRVRSRGKRLEPSPVKETAEELGIEVRTPSSLKDEGVQAELAALAPDLICVAAYGAILPKAVLVLPTHGCINVHASLLPRHRGAAPIERAILEGDAEAGVCIMEMEEGLDTGAWCVRRSIPIGDMDAPALTAELASLGSTALLTAIAQIEAGSVRWTAQEDAGATYAAKLTKGELDLDPAHDAVANVRRVRASSDAHPSRARIAGRDVTVLKASADIPDSVRSDIESDGAPVGAALIKGKGLFLVASDGTFEVCELKPAGKNAMTAQAFIQGNPELGRDGRSTWSSL